MTQEKLPDNAGAQNVVKDIFERKKPDEISSKKISSLFGGPAPAQARPSAPSKERQFSGYLPVGLDISPAGISFARVGRSEGKLMFAGGSLAGYLETGASIKKYVSGNALKGDAVVGLPAADIKFRVIKLPPMPESEIDSAVTWAAAEALGVDARRMQEMSMDYAVLREAGMPSAETSIFIAAANREAVLEKMREASDAGLNVLAVEPSPLSLYAAMCSLSTVSEDASRLTLMLNIGRGSGEIIIGLGRDVWAVQEVAISADVLQGALNDDGSVASKPSVSSALESLIIDIEHSFKTVSGLFARPDSLSPGRIAVSGPGAVNKGICPFLNKTFNIPVDLFDPLGAGPGLAAAVGLALRGAKDEAV